MNELTLTYPSTITRGGLWSDRVHHAQPVPHRDRRSLFERAELET